MNYLQRACSLAGRQSGFYEAKFFGEFRSGTLYSVAIPLKLIHRLKAERQRSLSPPPPFCATSVTKLRWKGGSGAEEQYCDSPPLPLFLRNENTIR